MKYKNNGTDSKWNHMSGKDISIIKGLTENEADFPEDNPIFRVAFKDRTEINAFADELISDNKVESKYTEVESDFFDEIKERQTVDAWVTNDYNEEGTVIAEIDLAEKQVYYIDPDAKFDNYAQEVIKEVIENGYMLTE